MVFLCRVNTGSQANRSGHGFRVDPCPKENLRTSNPKVSWQSDSRELAFALKFLKAGSFSSFHRNAGFPSLCSKLGKAGNLKEYEQRHMFSPHCAIGKGKKSYFVKITLLLLFFIVQSVSPSRLRLEFPRETGLILRCAGKVGNPFETKQ